MIVVMGEGVVGSAVCAMLRHKGAEPVVYDPPKGAEPDLAGTEVAFICVPAPTLPSGKVDTRTIEECLSKLPEGAIAIIRSTILPGTTERLQQEWCRLHIYFVPEFLSEATAEQDAIHPTRTIVGVPASSLSTGLDRVKSLLGCAGVPLVVTEARAAEMAKYAANTFYAVKVSYFNQLFDMCNELAVDWEQVRHAVGLDPWTGAQHTDVMHGGYRGYGGKCLPKDARAFTSLARYMGVPVTLLEAAESYNDDLLGKAPEAKNDGRRSKCCGVPLAGERCSRCMTYYD